MLNLCEQLNLICFIYMCFYVNYNYMCLYVNYNCMCLDVTELCMCLYVSYKVCDFRKGGKLKL
jgi:hypothetical protein